MAFKLSLYILLLILFYTPLSNSKDLLSHHHLTCDRSLWDEGSTKKEGVGFRVRMESNSDRYAPEKKYVVFLEGETGNSKFKEFVLTVESLNHSDSGSLEKEDMLTKLSIECPNTVIHSSSTTKTQIHALWKAPSVDSGCVLVRAAVQDTAGNLYHSGNLSLKLCQGELDENVLPEILEVCGACSEASYQLIFEGLWSRQTHPNQFPDSVFEIGFQGVIGTSHTNDFRLYEIKKSASDGIAKLAETGETKDLEAELKAQSSMVRTVIKAKSLLHRNINGKTYAKFRTDDKHHLMSLIAKFTPSPDWVVGISGLELCLPNNSWAVTRVVNLSPIDVGTIEGVSYKAEKVPTMPRAAIRKISPKENSDSPFYNENAKEEEIPPLAKVTVQRQRVFGKTKCIMNHPDSKNHECAVTDWTDDGRCNCRTLFQRRRRTYKNPSDKHNKNCSKIPLVEDVPCTCNGYPPYGNTIPNNTSFTYRATTGSPVVSCETTEWGSWAECTCQNPYRIRRRYYRNSLSAQGCTELLWEKKDCVDMPACDPSTNGRCAVTEWSEWSPCDATCEMTMGKRLRTRLFLIPGINNSICNVQTIESEPCRSERTDCNGEPKNICLLPKEEGPCSSYFVRWYYNVREKRCLQFVYGGCRPNKNNFKNFEDCHGMCGNILREPPHNIPGVLFPDDPKKIIDCELSQWAEWSECSRTCGTSWKERRRAVEVNAENGGQSCKGKLHQRKRCKHLPPCEQTF